VTLAAGALAHAERPVTTFPPAFDSGEWTSLLERYVDGRGLVDYARWKASGADRGRLETYLSRFAGGPGSGVLTDAGKIAILINAYNAFIVATILDHYPVESIRSIPGAFTTADHPIGGQRYSLDEIEHTAVRLGGYRVHATIVCASRSCPPLDRRAYEASDLFAHAGARMEAWMARPDLYQFDPDANLVRLPKYFDWYRADFEKEGVPVVLARHAPARYRAWLALGRFRTAFLDYDWSLNAPPSPR
jgi:uncharacterized protein DUF547